MTQVRKRHSAGEIEATASNWILRRDAGLTAAERVQFEQWQAQDQRHMDAVVRMTQTWSVLGRPLDAGQADWLLHRLATRAAKRRRRRVGVVAAGTFALLVATMLIFHPDQGAQSDAPVEQGIVVRPETRHLPDGSVVELRPGADLFVDYAGQFRRVWLKRGEAYFKVAKDPGRPFLVSAGGMEVRAVGTAFSVQLAGERIDVLVTGGRVAVKPVGGGRVAGATPVRARTPIRRSVDPESDHEPFPRVVPPAVSGTGTPPGVGASQSDEVVVDAGNLLVLSLGSGAPVPASSPAAVPSSEVSTRLAWRVPKLELSDIPLSEAVALMNRFNAAQFVIDDPSLRKLRISGYFRADSVDTFIRLLEATCGVTAVRFDDTIRLRQTVADRAVQK
jgi:transmembrane sensor